VLPADKGIVNGGCSAYCSHPIGYISAQLRPQPQQVYALWLKHYNTILAAGFRQVQS
jgi:hypothetical protein